MKTWTFTAQYRVEKECFITAETVEEAQDLYHAMEFEEGNEIDSILLSTYEPKWDKPDEF